ncbi:MAG: hypothetical protein B6245_10505 [Desulfobacteraceae bacterium 4572_88]|nr:MAG: hypothetical protein B6245_10505 [Desulfobacteraceae bacterium 4572_88]
MSDKNIEELIKRDLSEIIAAEQKKMATPVSEEKRKEIAVRLPSMYQIFRKDYEFKEGQLVEWKEGLKNKVRPRFREPAIVIEILKRPVIDQERDSGTPYFRESLDMIIGVTEENEGNFLFFHVDKRRFKPLEEIQKKSE